MAFICFDDVTGHLIWEGWRSLKGIENFGL
jgi:hypothetical protein